MLALPYPFGRYTLLELLGEGGMGIVYRAEDTRLRRQVALKVMRPELRFEPQFEERFNREAQLAAGLRHPNIVTVHDFGHEGDSAYFTMELVEGSNLADRMGGSPMPLAEVATILSPVAEALECAHRHGVVHRDVKPHNILIDRDGRVMVTDFGIARMFGPSLYTSTGRMIGTPEYMAPEQAEDAPGRVPDGRADIYALGVVLFQMVTGTVPFRATSPIATALKHLKDPPPRPRRLRPDLPATLERVILKGLEKEPDRRYQRPTELVGEWQAALDGGRKQTWWERLLEFLRTPRGRPWAYGGAGLAAVGLAAALILWPGGGGHGRGGTGGGGTGFVVSREYSWNGARFQYLAAALAQALEVSVSQGAVVESVAPGSRAAEIGLEAGDVVTDVSLCTGESGSRVERTVRVTGEADLIRTIEAAGSANVESLIGIRAGQNRLWRVRAQDVSEPGTGGSEVKPPPEQPDPVEPPAAGGWIGVQLGELSEEKARELGIEPGGVLITGVVPESPADEAGLEAEDVITTITLARVTQVGETSGVATSKRSVTSPGDLRETILAAAPGDTIVLEGYRDGDDVEWTLKVGTAPRS